MSELRGRRILVIDDEPQIRRLFRTTLEAHGGEVFDAAKGEAGLVEAASRLPELTLLDLQLPDLHGLEVLRRLREWYDRPVMVVSVVDDEQTIVRALDLGADDYLTKPFGVPVLLARLRALLRRGKPGDPDPVVLRTGRIEVDAALHEVWRLGESPAERQLVRLTATEFNLLLVFARNAGRVLTHRQILREVWGPGATGDVQYLRVYIGHLRRKLEVDPNRPELLVTEPGVGYRLTAP